MFRSNSLKTKISFFLILFSVILILSFIAYLYGYGKNSINNKAVGELQFFSRLLADKIENEIQACKNELNSLRYQLDYLQTQNYKIETAADNILSVESFIKGYARKYSEIIIINKAWKRTINVVPVIVFGGEIRAQVNLKNISLMPDCISEILKNEPVPMQVIGPDYKTTGRSIYFAVPVNGNENIFLAAAIPINYVIDKSIESLNLPESLIAVIADTNGIILYSKQEKQLLKKLDEFFDRPQKSLNQVQADGTISEDGLLISKQLISPGITLLLEKSIEKDIDELNLVIIRSLSFAGFLLIIVVILVRILTGRLTSTFQEITSTAEKLSAGDFSSKINIKRNDELGVLIVSFNEMVDKLNQSYRSLNIVNEELRNKIDELNRTKTELSQKQRLALIGETVSKISHEIQNKIGGVSIWVQNLELASGIDETSEEYIKEIKLALNSFMEMLANFKRFYREPELNKSEFEAASLCKTVLDQFNQQSEAGGIQIKTHFLGHPVQIFADYEQLEKVLSNVFLNALYYAPKESIIDFTCEIEHKQLIISVADQGPGIPQEIAEQVFQPFFTTRNSGSGLGLALVKNIVTAHGGEVFFDNCKNGACLVMRLPI